MSIQTNVCLGCGNSLKKIILNHTFILQLFLFFLSHTHACTSVLFLPGRWRCCSVLHQSNSEALLYLLVIFYSSQERLQHGAALIPASQKQAAVREPESPDTLPISASADKHHTDMPNCPTWGFPVCTSSYFTLSVSGCYFLIHLFIYHFYAFKN